MNQVDTIEIIDYVETLNIAKAEARAEARADERKKIIMSLYSHNFEPLDIANLLSLSKEEVDKIISAEENHYEVFKQ